jgi:type II secretory pathway pseudopilin PulG
MKQDLIIKETIVAGREDRSRRGRPATHRHSHTTAFTLVEVMIAAVLFTFVALTVSALVIQNNNMTTRLRYKTNATNAALNILEQIRVLDFTNLTTLYTKSSPLNSPPCTYAYLRVLITDPNAPDLTGLTEPAPDDATTPGFQSDYPSSTYSVPPRYRNIDLKLNVRDNTEIYSNWTACDLPLQSTATSGKTTMPMRFWLTFKYNTLISGSSTITATGQVFEITLVYQWKQPASSSSSSWESGVVKAAVKNRMPKQ